MDIKRLEIDKEVVKRSPEHVKKMEVLLSKIEYQHSKIKYLMQDLNLKADEVTSKFK